MKARIDFGAIKNSIAITAVLEHYGWKGAHRSGRDALQGPCPIHGGKRLDTFHVDARRNVFHCFSCQAGGSVLDLVAAMEGCSVYQAAGWLREWLGGPSEETGSSGKRRTIREKEMSRGPLGFALRPVDSGHEYLRQRGIDVETATQFGVGYYDGPGLMHGRVVIPIHDERGQLLAYAGRSMDGALPKYKLPTGFAKASVLFNLHRAVAGDPARLVVVEGSFDCLRVHQAGQPGVVALMGCWLSAEQERLLVERCGRIVLMLDGDAAGQQAMERIADRLAQRCAVEVVTLAFGRQPDQLSREQIQRALSGAARRAQPGPEPGGKSLVEGERAEGVERTRVRIR